MVFSSIPAYNLDASNWQQQIPNHAQLMNPGLNNNTSPSVPHPAPSMALQAAHGLGSSIRPGSMAERARLANIPLPETALKCPRCESTNTKFCYFNNYSLTQPRHFCKTCRRYWTRGGALRNVPVGGGCRRNNKKSNKSNNKATSKSPATSTECHNGLAGPTNPATVPSSGGSVDAPLGLSGPMSPQFRFTAPHLVHHLGENFGFAGEFNGLSNYGENIISPLGGAGGLNFHGSQILDGSGEANSVGFYHLGGGYSFEPSGLYGGASRAGEKMSSSGFLHLGSVKLEDKNQELNGFSRRFHGMAGDEQHGFNGVGNSWMDRSSASFSSSSMSANNVV